MTDQDKKVVPVILCGGSGTRLWPLSRERLPKQFLSLLGEKTLLQQTAQRALACAGAPPENLVVVTGGGMAPVVEQQLSDLSPDMARHIVHEPMARNTAAAVALAALYVRETFGPDYLMWVLPADHHIADENALGAAYRNAAKAAQEDYLATFGIKPSRPETGYGYIAIGPSVSAELPDVHQASAFIEKPNRAKAEELLSTGTNLWNSGMFLFKTDTVLRNFHRYALDILSVLQPIAAEIAKNKTVKMETFARLPEQPFDKAIMEKSDRIAVVPCDIGWSDIGSWESLWEMGEKDEHGNVLMGNAIAQGSRNVLVKGGDRLVACVGLDSVVVIDAGDALLVMDKSGSDGLKTAVNALKKEQRQEVREPGRQSMQGWTMDVLKRDNNQTVRSVRIAPGRTLTLTPENGKNARLVTLQGEGSVVSGDARRDLSRNNTVEIIANQSHRLEAAAATGIELLIVESAA